MPFRIALKRVRTFLHIYRHRPLLGWPVKHFGKLSGTTDGDQLLRDLGWPPNLSCHQSSNQRDFTGDSKPSSRQTRSSLEWSSGLLQPTTDQSPPVSGKMSPL